MPPTVQALFAQAHQTARLALAQRLRDERLLLSREVTLLALVRELLRECEEDGERRDAQATLDAISRAHTLRQTYVTHLEAELAHPIRQEERP